MRAIVKINFVERGYPLGQMLQLSTIAVRDFIHSFEGFRG